ncbi:MAG: alpha/beta hydrolase fold [Tardiphaga sp.]|nr:alpha/beta hydrolase fold [Tardiphaga sp.]MDB5548847.1 alpha/beta hydrolase fold [Tardiphaga sp.]MDB5573008.1 alpha/beta hydrolase fold [Tardiphaga sp.]
MKPARHWAGPRLVQPASVGLHDSDMGEAQSCSRVRESRLENLDGLILLVFPLSGPAMTLISIPANPVPDNVVSGTIKASDGVELRFARWAPPTRRKGTVCLFTGRGECIEKYFETVRDLRDRGFAVAMIDWRGQGHSARRLRDSRKGHARDFADFELDVEALMQHVVLPDCPPPYFALAHSMGGAVMLRVAHSGKRWFDRMVLSAPMIDLPGRSTTLPVRMIVRALRWLGRGGQYVPGGTDTLTGTGPFLDNTLTSDPVRYARNAAILAEDPTLGIASPTVAWADTAFRAIVEFRAADYPAAIRQPILMMAASHDTIVSTAAIEEFAYHLRGGSHLVIAGSRHEILQEQDRYRQQFWAAFDAFIPGTPLY